MKMGLKDRLKERFDQLIRLHNYANEGEIFREMYKEGHTYVTDVQLRHEILTELIDDNKIVRSALQPHTWQWHPDRLREWRCNAHITRM